MKILHVITGLYTGGAETMLFKLLARMPRTEADNAVISLTGGGPLVGRIAELGIPVTALSMTRGVGGLLGFPRLIAAIRRAKPDLLQSWMYHANLLAGLAAPLAGRPPVLWNIRQSDLDPDVSKRSTIAVAKLGARLSRRLPRRIVCCAEIARDVHAALGYDRDRMTVIPNGFDLEAFQPSEAARGSLRQELGVAAGTPLVALPARVDPQKDHRGFLAAATIVRQSHPDAEFVLCGDDTADNQALAAWIAASGLADACHRLGPRGDMARIMAGSDIVVSASAFGEGFPNILGEAMAAGTPCVATDVGDSRLIVGDTGGVVPPRDPAAMAAAISRLLALSLDDRRVLGLRARGRIAAQYEIGAIAARYLALYRTCLTERV